MDDKEQRIDIDVSARQRMTNFRFGSYPVNSILDRGSPPPNVSHPDLLTTSTNTGFSSTSLDASPSMTPMGTPTAKAHQSRSSHHSRTHSRTGSHSTAFTLPLKPSTMNNVPLPSANIPSTTVTQSPSVFGTTCDSAQPTPSGSVSAGTTTRSRPNSHHKRRSSVSTRRESAELMGVFTPDSLTTDLDAVVDGRRMALWALEGKGKATTRRPDFIGGYTKVEIPELTETALNFSNGDENEPPSWSSAAFKASVSTHSSFPPLGSSSNKRDSFPSFSLGNGPSSAVAALSGKRDSFPSFGLGSATSGSKRDSFNGGFGLGMGIGSVSKRDSFGKFLNSCSLGDQLGTLLEEEEDVEEEIFDEESGDLEDQADQTFDIVDDTAGDSEGCVEDPQEDATLLEMDLDEEPLPHLHCQPGSNPPSDSSKAQTLVSTSAGPPTPMSTSSTPISPPIWSLASTDISIATSGDPTTPVAESSLSFAACPSPSSTASNSSRPRPVNLTLNLNNNNNKFVLRPLSLTPDSLPLNTRASFSVSPSSSDTPTSSTGPTAYTPTPRVAGLRPLSLVAAVASPAGSTSAQTSVTRRMSLISSSSPSNTSGSGSSSSVPYRRSSMSVESESSSSVSSIAPASKESNRPNYQYATLRRTSQSHLPTPGATPTSAVSPLHLGLPFGMSMMREECEDEAETRNESFAGDDDTLRQDGEGDASTPTGPASATQTTKLHQLHNPPTLDRPLSPTEQAFLYRSHTSLLGRISELEDIIAKSHQQNTENRRRGRSRGLSAGSDISAPSSYGHRHGRFESSASSISTNTSLDSASPSLSSSEPSDELLQLITDLKSERDGLMHDVQTYQLRVAELEKTIATLTRRVEAERRESWVAQERMSVLEIERRCAAEEVAKLKNVVKDLQVEVTEIERVKMQLQREKERISNLENQVEAVRRELDVEKVKTRQAEDEVSMLRRKIVEMDRDMEALRAMVAEQQAQILRFKQTQSKRIVPKYNSSLNSFASTSGSGSVSLTNLHSHMSSSSTLAADVEEVDGDSYGDDASQFKYVPFGMSPPRTTLGSVAEAEEEALMSPHRHTDRDGGDVPRDITVDENEDGDEEAEDELAHYEDDDELDQDAQLDEDEEDVVWGEDNTTSSFGDFVPRRGVLQSLAPTPTPTPTSSSRPGHTRLGSMEKGWSFATARANSVQTQSHAQPDVTPTKLAHSSHGADTKYKPAKVKVDRFFDCLDGLDDEDEDDDGGAIGVKVEFSDSKSFWSGVVRGSEEDDEMDLPPFLLPVSSTDTSTSASPSNSDLVSEEEEDEEFSAHLATPAPTPSWKDLIAAKLEVVAEEDEEDLEEDEDDCPPSPSLRPTLARNASFQSSLLPRPSSISDRTSATSLVPSASLLSQMTPNTVKTTLDATLRSPSSTLSSANASSNRWSIGASLGLGLPSTMTAVTPVKSRYSLSPSTPSPTWNSRADTLPTPPPTLIPRLVPKSGLSSPTSPMSPSPLSNVSSSLAPSSSPVFGDFTDRERSPPSLTPVSKYNSLSPSRIPTPSKKISIMERAGVKVDSVPTSTASNKGDHTGSSATGSSALGFLDNHSNAITDTDASFSVSFQDDASQPGSGSEADIVGKGHVRSNDNMSGGGTLVTCSSCETIEIAGHFHSSSSRSKRDSGLDDTRSPFSDRMRLVPNDNNDDIRLTGPISTTNGATMTSGGFAARLTRFWRGNEDDSKRASAYSKENVLTRLYQRRPTYVNRETQVEALRARIWRERQMQGESQGCRMKDEVISFVGCSQCADSAVIVL